MDNTKVAREVQTSMCILACERLTDWKITLRSYGAGAMGLSVNAKICVVLREVTDLYTLKRRVERAVKEEIGEYN